MPYTAFLGDRLLASGDLGPVAEAAARAPAGQFVIFDDETGAAVDLDLRQGASGAIAEFEARGAAPAAPRSRGRPKLGVVAREVTLLPRHWDWLARQPGGASAALRRLVEEAQRGSKGADQARQAQQALHRVMSTLAGNLPGFEAALRALYALDDATFDAQVAAWPTDIREYLGRLAGTERSARA